MPHPIFRHEHQALRDPVSEPPLYRAAVCFHYCDVTHLLTRFSGPVRPNFTLIGASVAYDMVHRSSFSLQSHAPGYRRLRKLLLAKLRAIARRVVPPSQSPEPALRLDQLPLEILEEIFAYASTDGGPTACSLSLVSKRIHAASRATRFTSVSLTAGSLDSLSKLLEQYHQARKTAIEHRCQKPRVRHLCIVADPMICHVTPYSPFYSAWDYFGRLHPNPLEEQIRKEKESRTEEEWVAFAVEREKQYHRGVSQLLSSVAEDLETLCIFPWRNFTTPQHQYRFNIDRSDLPKLRELWTGCDLSPFSFLVRPDQSRRPLVPFPALTRLHVFENTPSLDLSEWPKYAPRMESLRIKVPYNTFAIAEPHFLTALRRTLGELP